MSWMSWALWSFVATVVLTGLSAGAQGLGLTRMDLPYLLGTMFTPDRDRARIAGFGVHLVNGWLFSIVYVLAFQAWHRATWWLGALIGLVHAGCVLTFGMKLLPDVHPRMASETHGPTAARRLEPPGILALHYGVRTPIAVVVAHVVFGMILGGFYHVR